MPKDFSLNNNAYAENIAFSSIGMKKLKQSSLNDQHVGNYESARIKKPYLDKFKCYNAN